MYHKPDDFQFNVFNMYNTLQKQPNTGLLGGFFILSE